MYALGVHLVVIAFLAISFRWSALDTSYVLNSDSPVIQAFMVGPVPVAKPSPPTPRPTPHVTPTPAPMPIVHKGPSPVALAQARAQQLAHQKALEEALAQAQARAKAKVVAKARAQVAARKAAQARAKALAQLKAEEQQAALKARMQMARQIAAAAKRAEVKAARAAARGVVDRYKALIEARVSAAWVSVPGAKGLRCDVAVRVIAGGQVVSVRVLRSSGNAVFDRSVVAAIYNAAPLPVPKSPAKLEYLSRFHFVFRAPEESSP